MKSVGKLRLEYSSTLANIFDKREDQAKKI